MIKKILNTYWKNFWRIIETELIMQQEQSQECYEHHMMLNGKLDKVNHFLFGDTEHAGEVSFVSKVNLMFDELKFIKQSLITSIFVIITSCIFLGQQLYQIDTTSKELGLYIERQKQVELQLAKLEAKIDKQIE